MTAKVTVDDMLSILIEDMCLLGAIFYTCSATDALVGQERQLGLYLHAFRIVAPAASQWASFKKNGRADAGAIVKRKALDFKNVTDDAHNDSTCDIP